MDATRMLSRRLRGLARSRPLLAAAALASLAGAALTTLPLFEVPGFELGAAMALMLVVVAGAAGIAAARQERALGEKEGPAEPLGHRVGAGFGAAALFSCCALILPLLAAVAGALTSSRCSPWVGAGFYLLLPIPTALLASATGLALGFATRRSLHAGPLYFALVLASALLSALPLLDGPQVFYLNHFAGYFPGPLYDEALKVDGRIVAFRGLTLLWTALVLVGLTTLLDPRALRLGRPAPTLPRVSALLLLIAGIGTGAAFSFELGLRTTDDELARALGGRSETEHLILHYPRTKPAAEVRRLERDLEFSYAHLSEALGAAPDRKIVAWFHASPAEKLLRVGAARTDFCKPWRYEFHVADGELPHRTSRHEMAHAFGAAFGAKPFGVSARHAIFVNIGLVEGLAVAAGDRPDELTLHEWAAAMRRLKLAPDIRSIVAPVGFYGQPPSRAYTLAGSFLRFVSDTYGKPALRALYAEGDFQKALGKGLDPVAGEWERFLDALPLSDRAMHTAQLRFERPSLFGRPCAREVALLQQEASEMAAADPELSLSLLRRCQQIEPENPAHLRAQAELLRKDDPATAQALWEQVLEKTRDSAGARAQALLAIGDLAWERGDLARARQSFQEALDLHRDQATDRTAWVKLESLSDPEAGPLLRRLFARGPGLEQVMAIAALSDRRPEWATGPYLVGRQLVQHGSARASIPYLERARQLGLGIPELTSENLRLLARAAYLAGDCARAREALDELARSGSGSDRAFAEDWKERCAFEERVYGGPIVEEQLPRGRTAE